MGGSPMKRFDLVVPMKDKRRIVMVEAYETPTPGLFVHRDIEDRYRWAVTHWSGVLVGSYEWETRDEAIAFATELVDVVEWHRPIDRIEEVWDHKDIRESVKAARISVVGARSQDSEPLSGAGTSEGPLGPESPAYEATA